VRGGRLGRSRVRLGGSRRSGAFLAGRAGSAQHGGGRSPGPGLAAGGYDWLAGGGDVVDRALLRGRGGGGTVLSLLADHSRLECVVGGNGLAGNQSCRVSAR
jgi:hypothetical protein